MNRIALPATADTAVLYTLYTHMSHGASTSGDQVYAAHALLGELAGSWFKFVSDAQLERGERSLTGLQSGLSAPGQVHDARGGEDHRGLRARRAACWSAATPKRSPSTSPATTPAPPASASSGIKTAHRAKNAKTQGARRPRPTGSFSNPLNGDCRLGPACPCSRSSSARTTPAGRARQIALADPNAEVLATYPDGSPAILSRKLGKGRVITFAANPFAPQVTVDASAWPAAFKGLQQWPRLQSGPAHLALRHSRAKEVNR